MYKGQPVSEQIIPESPIRMAINKGLLKYVL